MTGGVRAAVLALAWLLAPMAAVAQGLTLGGSDGPVQIDAEDGIEWRQDRQVFEARGNAVARRGEVEVRADVLSAHYREAADGSSEIWRLDAVGKVRISSANESAFGERGIYDVDNAILVLRGGDRVRLVTEQDEITADDQLEYWEQRRMAVARGNASAVRGDKRLNADVLAAYFSDGEDGEAQIDRVEAFDDVEVVTADEIVRADRGVYDVASGIATLSGSVRVTRGANQLNGCSAEVDLNSGVSTLKACAPGSDAGARVRGLLQPRP